MLCSWIAFGMLLVSPVGAPVEGGEYPGPAGARPPAPHREALVLEVNALLRQLSHSSAPRRDAARDGLLRLSRRENLRGVMPHAVQLYHEAAKFWRDARALLEVRTGVATRTGFEEFTTHLGSGSPVRLQLPRLRTIQFGGTVVLPGR